MAGQVSVFKFSHKEIIPDLQSARYTIVLLPSLARFSVDGIGYSTEAIRSVLFLSPYQKLSEIETSEASFLQFHGDFYCIEYHKEEVACNGLLFNNIFTKPYVQLSQDRFLEIETILKKIEQEWNEAKPFTEAIIKTYIQLILALCSQEKAQVAVVATSRDMMPQFQNLLDQYFLHERSPSFYADILAISPSALSKKTKKVFGKTPTELIQERVILEAKKQLHLTQKSVKEIAQELHFQDEYYFSRYFKKYVGHSPSQFRKEVGISIVATLSARQNNP